MFELDISIMDTSKPLKPAAFHILLALAPGDNYGYAMMQAVRAQSAGRVPLQTGSFYRHLGKLIDGGLIAEAPAPVSADVRRGTYYRLTTRGKRVLKAEQERLADLLAVAASVRTARKANV
jgi:DNA-binding PadR family transcriptional regulator